MLKLVAEINASLGRPPAPDSTDLTNHEPDIEALMFELTCMTRNVAPETATKAQTTRVATLLAVIDVLSLHDAVGVLHRTPGMKALAELTIGLPVTIATST